VGEVEGVGTNVTVVLKKRSMRADNCQCVLWTDDGFKKLDIPVTTYRGYVKDDPLMQVNGNIEPGGLLYANFSENRMIVGRIRGMKITVPRGKCTPTMSTGNKVVPLSSLRKRQVPTQSGYLVPEVTMRRTRWLVRVYSSYTSHSSIEKAVSEVEQRMNDADFVYARDVGTAWEIDTLVVWDPKATKPVDWNALYPDDPGRLGNCKHGGFTGAPGRNQGKQQLNVTGIHHEARILLHESAHVYGTYWHQLDLGDGLCGGGAYWAYNNVALLLESMKSLNETNFPGVIYNGALPPHAMYDFANTRKDTPVTIDVLDNDYDGNGDAISLQAVQEKTDKGGTVMIARDGKAVYTPAPGFVGQDKFTYTVVDSTGVGNRSGQVKVDVRADGLAAHFDFEEPEVERIEDRRSIVPLDGELNFYDLYDSRPKSEKLLYHFRNMGPYDGGRGTAHWIDYAPVSGVRGMGILNTGLLHKATVKLGDAGDPGRGSLSVSVWVLYPGAPQGSVIICKGAVPAGVINGWSICHRRDGEGFVFAGNTVRLLGSEAFSLQSEDRIESNRWYHLAMVIDRETKRLRAWVNNKEVTTPGKTVSVPDGVIEYYGPLQLFNSYTGKWWNGTSALVDEVKIFTSALTPKQVVELYAEGKDARVPDLKAE